MADDTRLIETAFPLKQASLDSVHEKNVRHGHISTLHIWPARRPLAACRAAILATLLPDPGTPEKRRRLCERIGGKIEKSVNAEQRATEKTGGGILRWLGGEPKGAGKKREEFKKAVESREKDLEEFRKAILAANDGKPPKVYDPFSGGGAIPLEAMRLGCETWANDLNPVSVFLLGATLKYPQMIGDEKLPLPEFIRQDREFMEEFLAAHPRAKENLELGLLKTDDPYLADLAWHVRAWGKWTLREAQKKLGARYPAYAVYEPLNPAAPYEPQEDRLVPLDEAGAPDIDALNRDFGKEYLQQANMPRWRLRPTVAYLWARTAICPNCRKTIPLLKTRWLCKTKSGKRAALICRPEGDSVVFDVWNDVPLPEGAEKEKKEKDQQIGKGYMSRSGAKCPHCGNIASMDDLKRQGKAGRLGAIPTAVVYEGGNGKRYRPWRKEEIEAAKVSDEDLAEVFKDVPFGMPEENIVEDAKRNTWCVQYGVKRFKDLFSRRQLLALGTLVCSIRKAIEKCDRERESFGYDEIWVEAIGTYLSLAFDKSADYNSYVSWWVSSMEIIAPTFTRFALPMAWDFSEIPTCNQVGGSYNSHLNWITRYLDIYLYELKKCESIHISQRSAIDNTQILYQAIITDPPYYDAIGYSVLMDFFFVWLKRIVSNTPLDCNLFAMDSAPKWDTAKKDGELIDDASRHNNDKNASRKAYEDGMAKVFQSCHASLTDNGRFVVVFAHKNPAAWETLVSAIIRAGFTVTASWPIQTERTARPRGFSSAALSSSVWLVCKKRPATAKAGWDTKVLAAMEANITEKLREFWDAGIRGPDFVWAATGPALAAYSAHPVVKKTSAQGESMGVNEFLGHVRKMVVNFVVGRLLSGACAEADGEQMDGVTAYYLLHRNDFGMEEAPAGACILYATACGLTDRDLEAGYRLLKRKGGATADDDSEDGESDSSETGGGKMALISWSARRHDSLGLAAPDGAEAPLVDRAHKLMHLWKAGDLSKVDAYIDSYALRSSELFKQLLQALTELSHDSERALLESVSNHLHGKGSIQKEMTSLNLNQ